MGVERDASDYEPHAAGMNTLRTLTRINQMKFARTCIALAAIVAPGKNLRTNHAGALFALNKLAQSN